MAITEDRKIDRDSEDYSPDEAFKGAYARVVSDIKKGKDVHNVGFGGNEDVSAGMLKKKVADTAFREFGGDRDEILKFTGFERLIDAQYEKAVSDLKKADLSPKERESPVPSTKEAFQILKKKLTLGQLEVIAGMENPVFIMKPKTTYKRFQNGLEKMIKIGRPNSREEEWERREKETGVDETITGWEIGFVEGAKTLDGGTGKLESLIKKWKSNGSLGEEARLLTPNEFMLLSMRMVGDKKRPDPRRFNVFRQEGSDDVIEGDGCISGGYLKKESFALLTYKPERSFNDADFRYGVMVDAA